MSRKSITRKASMFIAIAVLLSLVTGFAVPVPRRLHHPQGKGGSFKVGMSPSKLKRGFKLNMTAEDRKDLQVVADELNQVFTLPQNVYLLTADCGEVNAYFSPETKEITMCTEYVTFLHEVFAKAMKNKDAAAEAADDAVMLIFFHELGHALINLYDLPITGKEEDAVDQLAVLIAADGSKEGAKSVINGAISWTLIGQDIDDSAFADEHSLNKQRFYNMLCLLYGQDPELHKPLVTQKTLPEARAELCPGEYARVEKAWGTMLAPHIKN